jgi:hypothetical protein
VATIILSGFRNTAGWIASLDENQLFAGNLEDMLHLDPHENISPGRNCKPYIVKLLQLENVSGCGIIKNTMLSFIG